MHEEAFTNEAASLFPLFQKFKGFYLVGGTALALQIGHRVSVDFDFFCFEELAAHLLPRVKRVFSGHSILVTYAVSEQLNLILDGIKVTFFYYPYPIVEPFVLYKNIALASVREIAAMKAFAVGKRIAYKDYVDWYFLLRDGHVNLEHVIALARTKFGDDFNDRLFLGQLSSLDDVPTQKINFLKEEPTRELIGKFLKEVVKKYVS